MNALEQTMYDIKEHRKELNEMLVSPATPRIMKHLINMLWAVVALYDEAAYLEGQNASLKREIRSRLS